MSDFDPDKVGWWPSTCGMCVSLSDYDAAVAYIRQLEAELANLKFLNATNDSIAASQHEQIERLNAEVAHMKEQLETGGAR